MGSTDFLEKLRKLRENIYRDVYIHMYTFMCKLGAAWWKGCIGPGMGKGWGPSMLCYWHAAPSAAPCIHQTRSALNPILWGYYGGFINRHDWLHPWLLAAGQPQSFLPSHEVKVSNPLITCFAPALIYRCFPNSHFIYIRKDVFITLNIGNSLDFRSCEQGTVEKDQIYMRNLCWQSELPNICFL